MNNAHLLVGDIGGTHARFALADANREGYQHEQVLLCADYETPELAIDAYLQIAGARSPSIICLAAAGPVFAGGIDLTNNDWLMRESSLYKNFEISHARLLNDFEAVAYSLADLDESHLEVIGPNPMADLSTEDFTVGVIGPGTGLGAAALMKRGQHVLPLITEAGHVGFAPESPLQSSVWEILWQRHGRVSDERLVSGTGIENIYSALSELGGQPREALSATQIFARADSDKQAAGSVNLFFEILGQVAGNFALSHSAFDGIYIAGGIVQRYPELLEKSSFRSSFENKGRHRHIMEQVPTALISHVQAGLLGASVVARKISNTQRQQQP